MKEEKIVDLVENHLSYKNRYYMNIHGTVYSRSGNPDFLTLDKNGNLLAIECKVDGKNLAINQIGKAIEILKSGGRFIVAVSDFDIDLVDLGQIEKFSIGDLNEFDEKLYKIKYHKTKELVL